MNLILFLFLGVFFLAFGLIFLFAPKWIILLSQWGNRLVFTDHDAVAHRKFVGSALFVLGLIMFYRAIS